jgi:hypothetical protein
MPTGIIRLGDLSAKIQYRSDDVLISSTSATQIKNRTRAKGILL